MPFRPTLAASLIAGALMSTAFGGAASAALWPFAPKADAKTDTAAKPPVSAPAAAPAPAPAKAAPTPAADLFIIPGFRAAHFGMTREEVLAAINTDFGVHADKVTVTVNEDEGTTLLVVQVPKLEPGHVPAEITYVLGATSKTLIRVGVAWTLAGEPTADQRRQMVNDGVVVMNLLHDLKWAPGATHFAVPLGPNAVALFSAQDPVGTAVELNVQGVQYDQPVNGKTVSSPPAKGPAALMVLYTRNIAHPDIRRLPKGAF